MMRIARAIAIIATGLVLALGPSLPLAADEVVDIYKELYRSADTLSQQLFLMTRIVELKDPAIAPMLSDSLSDLLLRQESIKERTQREIYFELVKLIAATLGEFGYKQSAPFLWDLVVTASDPLVKAEGLMALGKVKAVEYGDKISLLLRDLNFKPTADADSGEKIAYGAIAALRMLKDAKGWVPVFFASDGWYSSRTRQFAEEALPEIAEDPTDMIRELIPGESTGRKIRALMQGLASKAPAAKKTALATFALAEGHKLLGSSKPDAEALGDLRRKAISGLVLLKSKDPSAIRYLVMSYEWGELDEKLLALQALGTDGGDEAAAALRKIILDLDALRKDNITDQNKDRLARAAIENAGKTGNSAVKAALIAVVSNSKWSGSVINAANAALKLIK